MPNDPQIIEALTRNPQLATRNLSKARQACLKPGRLKACDKEGKGNALS